MDFLPYLLSKLIEIVIWGIIIIFIFAVVFRSTKKVQFPGSQKPYLQHKIPLVLASPFWILGVFGVVYFSVLLEPMGEGGTAMAIGGSILIAVLGMLVYLIARFMQGFVATVREAKKQHNSKLLTVPAKKVAVIVCIAILVISATLYFTRKSWYYEAIVSGYGSTAEQIRKVYSVYGNNINEDLAIGIIYHHNTPSDVHEGLAGHDSKIVRMKLASGNTTSASALHIMAFSSDEDPRILLAIARNENTSSETLDIFIHQTKDEDLIVAAAQNHNLTDEQGFFLTGYDSEKILKAVLSNRSLSDNVLDAAAYTIDPEYERVHYTN